MPMSMSKTKTKSPITNTTKLTKNAKATPPPPIPPLRLLRRRQSRSRRLYSYPHSSSSVSVSVSVVTMMTIMTIMLALLLSSFTITGVAASNNLPNGFIAETVLTSSSSSNNNQGGNDVRGITGKFAPHPSGNTTKSQILIIVSKNGQVNVIENPDDSDENAAKSTLILDLALEEGNGNGICTNGERGLQSITVHPKFGLLTIDENPQNYVYLFYTNYLENCPVEEDEVTNGTWNVVNRFRMNAITLEIDYQSKEEIWRTSPLYDSIHNGGGMDFSSSSNSDDIEPKLYITTGDSGKKQTASNLHTVFGKLLRLNDDGTIPEDNPYTVFNGYQNSIKCGDPTNGVIIIPNENENENASNDKGDNKDHAICSEIYGYGFRNPFRIEMEKTNNNNNNKVRFTIGDVGGAFWEELSYGGTDYAGMNYGWPDWEGPCRKDSFSDCPIPNNTDSSNKTKTNNNAIIVEPFHYYQHRTKREGGAVAGQVFVPSTANWPSQYKYLFIDFIFLEIYNLIEDPTKECRTCLPPISGYKNESFYTSIQRPEDHINNARMVEMFFGPYKDTQALYVLKFGTHDSIIRIRYNGIVNNTPPVANFTFVGLLSEDYDSDQTQTQTFLSIGEDIQFNGSISSDVDESVGDILTYSWDFGDSSNDDIVDDGNNELGNSNNTDASMANNRTDSNSNEKMSTMSNPIHSYQKRGEYIVTLSVVDIYGQTQQKSNIVQIGIPPTATIVSPNNNDVFYVGEILELHGEAYDYNGNVLDDDTQLKWEVRKHHADHFHPFMDTTTGNNLSLYPAPEPEDFSAITNSYLQIILYATDSDGLTTIVNRIVQPSLVTVNVTSNIPLLSRDHEAAAANNMTIIVDDFPIVMNTNTNSSSSSLIKSWRNHELNLRIDEDDNVGANNKNKNDEAYTFIGWSDGNTDIERTIRLTESVQTITAYFCGNTGQQCDEDDYTINENELLCCNGLYCVSNKCIVDYVSSPDSSETIHDTDAYSDPAKPSSSSGNNKLNLPPGILIGLSCVIVLISILTCIICIKRKKQRKMENSSTNNNNNNNNTAIVSSIIEEIIDNGLMKDGNKNDDDNYSVDNNVTMNMSDGISSSTGDEDSMPTDDDPSSSSSLSLSLVETTDDSINNIEGHNNNDKACSLVHVNEDSSAGHNDDEEKGDTAATAASSVVD